MVTIEEYEARFRAAAPSFYQIFAESQGPSWKRRRKRRLRIAAIISAMIALATYADHGDNRHVLIRLSVIATLGSRDSLCPFIRPADATPEAAAGRSPALPLSPETHRRGPFAEFENAPPNFRCFIATVAQLHGLRPSNPNLGLPGTTEFVLYEVGSKPSGHVNDDLMRFWPEAVPGLAGGRASSDSVSGTDGTRVSVPIALPLDVLSTSIMYMHDRP
jgi:hypothetical protein